ncbi:MAG: ABC transporter permease [Paracoccaceae bacterium]
MALLRYIGWRLVTAVLTLTGAIMLFFGLIRFVPGDPISIMYGPRATPALRAAWEAEIGLDRPLWQQVGGFLYRAATGDFGTDIISGRSIGAMLLEALPNTLQLAAVGMVLAVVGGVTLGVLAARRPGGAVDVGLGLTSVAFITTPSFVVAIGLLLLFAIQLRLFPVIGAGEAGDMLDRLHHLVLPSVALAIGWVGYLARLVRASLLEVMAEQHVRMLRAYGVSERRLVTRYALRLALVPMVAVLGIGVGDMISNAVFVEVIFARPGIGSLIFNAIEDRNFPIVQAGVLFAVAIYVVANLAVDLINALLDPRIARSLGPQG